MNTNLKKGLMRTLKLTVIILIALILIPKQNANSQPAFPYVDLKISAGVQGLFDANAGTLSKDVEVTVQIRNNKDPYDLVSEQTITLDKSTMSGTARFNFVSTGTYYIVVKHRNSIETWSKDGGEALDENFLNEYDFRSSGNSFGDNQYDNGKFKLMYSGDVNQDGSIDGTDYSAVDNDILNFVTGDVATDLNGDGMVDGTDLVIANENADKFITVKAPEKSSVSAHNLPNTGKKNIKINQNYPNPFNPSTTIGFSLPAESSVKLSIYDITGREVATLVNQRLSAGEHKYQWNASNFSSGVYFYRISSPGFEITKQMNLIK